MLLLNREGKILQKLTTIPHQEKTITENFLQHVVYIAPDILPVNKIDSSYSRLIPIKREFPVKSGSIDVLYVTPEGFICIVETKLWRNPEAHRTVVAQILDYAKDLSDLSFQDFCEAATKEKGETATHSFLKSINTQIEDFDEIEFQHRIQESLSQGRFLLLIVGDKIYPKVALIADTIQSAPHLEFHLALAELQFYSFESNYLVTSNVVGESAEVTRAVVKIRYEEKKPELEVTAIEDRDPNSRGRTSLKEFLSQMPEGFSEVFQNIIEGWRSEGFIISWGTVGFTIRVHDNEKMKSILEAYPNSISIFTNLWARKKDLPINICRDFQEKTRKIWEANRLYQEGKVYLYYDRIPHDEYNYMMSEIDKTVRTLIEFYSQNNPG